MILSVGADSFSEAMCMGSEVYHVLKDIIKVLRTQFRSLLCKIKKIGKLALI